MKEVAVVAPTGVSVNNEIRDDSHRSVAVSVAGTGKESVRIDMGAGHEEKNTIIQFDIINSQAGAVDEVVRIGSVLGAADSYIRFGTTKSAADSVNGISDNFGVNVQQCQGFSEFSTLAPMFVKEIKIFSDNLTQLNQKFSHKTILPDFTIINLVQNIAWTREKSDFATNENVAVGSWLLSPKTWLEFTSKAGSDVTIILGLTSISDVRQFVRL
jgi:hypothetical protein